MNQVTFIDVGRARGVVLGDEVHVLKRSSSRYHLEHAGRRTQYVCQDGCCDRGLSPEVSKVIEQAKKAGATKVVLRTGQQHFYHSHIHGLPVSDVSNRVGEVAEGWRIVAAW